MPAELRKLSKKDQEALDRMKARGVGDQEIDTTLSLMQEGFSDQEIELALLRRAHGHLCSALVHLNQAGLFFAHREGDVFLTICRVAGALADVVPSYVEFHQRTNKPRRRD